MANNSQKSQSYSVHPVGTMHISEEEGRFEIEILPQFRNALFQLDRFSHVIVVWWADQHDNPSSRSIITTELPYAPGVKAGVFACRAEYRPNPVALTTTPIIAIDEERGVIKAAYLDAFDGTPVLDLKPYIPVSDRIRDYKVAEWLQDWPGWQEEAGEYFAAHATDFGS